MFGLAAEKLSVLRDKLFHREIKLSFMGGELQVEAKCWRDEVLLRFNAALKTVALQSGALPLAWWEQSCVMASTEKPGQPKLKMLSDWSAARKAAVEKVRELASPKLSNIREALTELSTVLLDLDPTYIIDLAYLDHLCSDGCLKMMQSHIREAITTSKSVSEASGKMMEVQRLQLMTLVPESVRDLYQACKKIVQDLERGECPSAVDETSGFMNEFLTWCGS